MLLLMVVATSVDGTICSGAVEDDVVASRAEETVEEEENVVGGADLIVTLRPPILIWLGNVVVVDASHAEAVPS